MAVKRTFVRKRQAQKWPWILGIGALAVVAFAVISRATRTAEEEAGEKQAEIHYRALLDACAKARELAARGSYAEALNAVAANVSFVEIESDKGHDAFLLDEPELFATVRGFINAAARKRGLPSGPQLAGGA